VHQLLHVLAMASAIFLNCTALRSQKSKLEVRAELKFVVFCSRCQEERRAARKKLHRTF
jgi:hypothetical protein